MYRLNKALHPDIFQGKNKTKKYFEGWYFKITDSGANNIFAVIPGISISQWDTHAFIQVLDTNSKVYYFRYDINDFEFNKHEFEIMVGENYFSKSRIRLNLKGKDLSLQGDLYFANILEYPRNCIHPGVMGPFLYVPRMECYHDIINIRHDIIGHLKISGKQVDFTGGIGYIEKDWGRSMPKTWIWFQCNHFQPDDVSVSVCIGKIPFLWGSFTGFIAMFRYKERIFMFTTYSGAKVRKVLHSSNRLSITIKDCRFRLDINVVYAEGGSIKAPVDGQMNRNITESVNAAVKVRFSKRNGRILYQGIGTNAGLEIVDLEGGV